MKTTKAGFILAILLAFWPNVIMANNNLLRPGTVTMIDLGAKSCIPCKMMAPILEKLGAEYKGRADIIFIDIREKPEEAKPYGIRAIPTQIFYDHTGQEVGRHEGFLDEKKIRDALDKLLEAQ